jgi:hypothetical protein
MPLPVRVIDLVGRDQQNVAYRANGACDRDGGIRE